MPAWAKGSLDWEKQCLEKRFRELSERYSRKIPMWEVTNETFWDRRKLTEFYMQPDFIEWNFALAENYFPANKLIINETHSLVWSPEFFHHFRSPYYLQIERAILKGARIDSIGMQFHMFYPREQEVRETADYYDPEQLYEVMDIYAQLGKPLQITELTVPAYSNDHEDEAIQAEIIRNLYRIWFSHPAMEGIIYWNLPDGYAYNALPGDMTKGENAYYGGLLRYDLTPKPAYYIIRDLFQKEWHTELPLEAEDGEFSFKGFYGDYDLKITVDSKVFTRGIHLGKGLINRHLTVTV